MVPALVLFSTHSHTLPVGPEISQQIQRQSVRHTKLQNISDKRMLDRMHGAVKNYLPPYYLLMCHYKIDDEGCGTMVQ